MPSTNVFRAFKLKFEKYISTKLRRAHRFFLITIIKMDNGIACVSAVILD